MGRLPMLNMVTLLLSQRELLVGNLSALFTQAAKWYRHFL